MELTDPPGWYRMDDPRLTAMMFSNKQRYVQFYRVADGYCDAICTYTLAGWTLTSDGEVVYDQDGRPRRYDGSPDFWRPADIGLPADEARAGTSA